MFSGDNCITVIKTCCDGLPRLTRYIADGIDEFINAIINYKRIDNKVNYKLRFKGN